MVILNYLLLSSVLKFKIIFSHLSFLYFFFNEVSGSDSLYCKNIFITMSVFNPRRVLPAGYLLCEHFSWSNPDQGKPLFSLRTAATKTHRLDLGPGCVFFRYIIYMDAFMFQISK